MNRAVLADTGPLYAAVDPDDAYHAPANNHLKRLRREKRDVIVTYPTLLEAHTLVLRRLAMRTASLWLDQVLQSGAPANPEAEDYFAGVKILSRLPHQSISLFDATLAAMGSRLKMEIWTYDQHFDIMGARVWRPAPA